MEFTGLKACQWDSYETREDVVVVALHEGMHNVLMNEEDTLSIIFPDDVCQNRCQCSLLNKFLQ